MKIVITTLGRVDNQVTLENLPKGVPRSLVVQQHEGEEHKKRWPGETVEELPAGVRSLGATRKHLLENHSGKIVLLDDDLTFYVRKDPYDWHLSTPSSEELEKMFWLVSSRLEQYAHVSVSAREGNNRIKDSWVENTRYMRFLGYNTRLFPAGLQLGRVDGMSDFDLNLQLLRAGKPSSVCFLYAQNHPGTQTPGGCSVTRTNESHEREIQKMVDWHPEFVRVREKRNKTGGQFGVRKELTIYWKRAYQSSS